MSTAVVNAEVDPERTCWVCFGNPADAPRAEWVSPCRCSGSMRWVHQACLRRWINDESGSSRDRRSCPQCQAPYTIIEPPHSTLVAVGDYANSVMDAVSPIAAGTAGLLFFWAGLGVYGAVTFGHVCGREGRRIVQQAHPAKLFLLMPLIPISLVLLRISHVVKLRLRLSEGRLRLQLTSPAAEAAADARQGDDTGTEDAADEPVLVDVGQEQARGGSGAADAEGEGGTDEQDLLIPEIITPVSACRMILGGLLLPYVSIAIGRMLPWRLHPFDRAVYGGILFEVFSSVYDHVYWHQKRTHRLKRRIVSFLE